MNPDELRVEVENVFSRAELLYTAAQVDSALDKLAGEITGKDLQWLREPQSNVANRTLLIVDDILDEGITLDEIKLACKRAGARTIYTAVLIEKKINRPRSLRHADFTGLTVPDRYVFGCGMDYKGYLRNCNGIYAVKDT